MRRARSRSPCGAWGSIPIACPSSVSAAPICAAASRPGGAGWASAFVADATLAGRLLPATGGLLLLSAGVPASVQRAVAFVLGVSLVAAYAHDAVGLDPGEADAGGSGVGSGE